VKNFNKVFDRLAYTVKLNLPSADLVLGRRRHGFIAWKRSRNAQPDQWDLYFFWLTKYDNFTFRLRNDLSDHALTIKFWPPLKRLRQSFGSDELSNHYSFELSFCVADLESIATPDLVHFVESTFAPNANEKSIYRWPLFAHHRFFPHYAWTAQAQRAQDRRAPNPPEGTGGRSEHLQPS